MSFETSTGTKQLTAKEMSGKCKVLNEVPSDFPAPWLVDEGNEAYEMGGDDSLYGDVGDLGPGNLVLDTNGLYGRSVYIRIPAELQSEGNVDKFYIINTDGMGGLIIEEKAQDELGEWRSVEGSTSITSPGEDLTIGRSEKSTARVVDQAVSSTHVRVRGIKGELQIISNALNGTEVYVAKEDLGQNKEVQTAPKATEPQASIITGSEEEAIKKVEVAREAVDDAFSAETRAAAGRVIEGGNAEVELANSTVNGINEILTVIDRYRMQGSETSRQITEYVDSKAYGVGNLPKEHQDVFWGVLLATVGDQNMLTANYGNQIRNHLAALANDKEDRNMLNVLDSIIHSRQEQLMRGGVDVAERNNLAVYIENTRNSIMKKEHSSSTVGRTVTSVLRSMQLGLLPPGDSRRSKILEQITADLTAQQQ